MSPSPVQMATEKIDRPRNIELIQHGSYSEIVRRWFDLVFVVVGVIGIFLSWLVFGHVSPDSVFHPVLADSPGSFFPLAIASAGAWLIYFGAAGSINRTRLFINHDSISVRNGPLPWSGNRQLRLADLKCLYVKAKHENRGNASRYIVHALTKSGMSLSLVGGPNLSCVQAAYIQQELERIVPALKVDAASVDAAAAEGLVIRVHGSGIEIVRRWFCDRTVGMTVFAIVWLTFVGFLSWKWLTLGRTRPLWPIDTGFDLLPLVINTVFLAVGILYAYRAATEWLNRTHITVNREMLSVRHGPLPWPGNKVVAVAEIRQLHATRSRWVSGSSRNRTYKFDLLAETQDGRRIKLTGGFESEGQAASVKHGIEKYLSLMSVQPTPPVAPGPGTGGTNIQSVLGIWLFILVWNGFIGWVVMRVIQGDGWRYPLWQAFAVLSPFVLIGLGLIYLYIPPTVAFFRQKSTTNPDPTSPKSGWGMVICMLVIAGGFILILMQAPEVPNRTPLTDKQVLEWSKSNEAMLIREYRTQMGEPQPATFFEGAWRRHGGLYNDAVRRVSIRSNGGGLSVRVWYNCIYGKPACDAGEVPAVLTALPDGLIKSLSARLSVPNKHYSYQPAIPNTHIWLWMTSGKYSYQPALLGDGGVGALEILVRENPATPLAEYVGEWGRSAPKGIGDFTRLTVRQTGTQSLAIHVWTLCDDGRECDLGEKPAQMELEADGLLREAIVVFETKYGKLTIILEPPYQGRFDAHGILYRSSKSTSSTSTVRVMLTRGHP